MKRLISSVFVLFLIALLIATNAGFLSEFAGKTSVWLDELDKACNEEKKQILDEMDKYWESKKDIVSVSVNEKDVRKVGVTLAKMAVSLKNGEYIEFDKFKEDFKMLIQVICEGDFIKINYKES